MEKRLLWRVVTHPFFGAEIWILRHRIFMSSHMPVSKSGQLQFPCSYISSWSFNSWKLLALIRPCLCYPCDNREPLHCPCIDGGYSCFIPTERQGTLLSARSQKLIIAFPVCHCETKCGFDSVFMGSIHTWLVLLRTKVKSVQYSLIHLMRP